VKYRNTQPRQVVISYQNAQKVPTELVFGAQYSGDYAGLKQDGDTPHTVDVPESTIALIKKDPTASKVWDAWTRTTDAAGEPVMPQLLAIGG
jgi:hypothetical protein